MLKITAAITTHNRLERLKKAIKSVESQTLLPDELVIIDDNSSDGTKEFCESLTLAFKLTYIRNDENRGAGFCRNKAIETASGEYIAFLDDDDEWEREKLRVQREAAEKENADLIYTAVKSFSGNSRKFHFHSPFPFPAKIAITLGNFAGITSTMMIRSEILQKIGGFDLILPALEDYELVIRMINAGGKIKGIKVPLVKYQPSNNGNVSGSPRNFFAASKIIMSKTSALAKPLQFIGLTRIFAERSLKSEEFRKKILRGENQ
ncbi:MAG: glycosyltransferase family 2 protein [Chitinispirillales bacterium]|nr:glycosyltransferase family 2 protein [Chitinispirillales bacterium]